MEWHRIILFNQRPYEFHHIVQDGDGQIYQFFGYDGKIFISHTTQGREEIVMRIDDDHPIHRHFNRIAAVVHHLNCFYLVGLYGKVWEYRLSDSQFYEMAITLRDGYLHHPCKAFIVEGILWLFDYIGSIFTLDLKAGDWNNLSYKRKLFFALGL